jgi:DNA repair protein RadA/Sms
VAAYRCSACGNYFPTRNSSCPTEGCSGGVATYARVSSREERAATTSSGAGTLRKTVASRAGEPVVLASVDASDRARIKTGIGEFDRVAGGGLVTGSLVLLAGEPGIGKSTLLAQVTAALVALGEPALYISGEESAGQIRLRAERLGLDLGSLEVLAENDATVAAATIEARRPRFAVIDSVQTLGVSDSTGSPGSPSQVREVTGLLLRTAKQTGTTMLLVGHVNKDAAVAGPKTLEHLVDAVFLLEGDRNGYFRVLRAQKNRFGAIDEVGIFEMREAGLFGVDPAEALRDAGGGVPFGRALAPVLEGTRPLLVEVQALVGKAAYNTGRRVAIGIAEKRLAMLLAVLERHGEIDLSGHDVYVSISAGLSVEETAIDAAVCAAIASSYWSTPIDPGTALIGEVSLGGALRTVRALPTRVRESARSGIARLIGPTSPERLGHDGIRVESFADLRGALDAAGVLSPAGATPAAGRPASGGGAPWWSGKRRGADEESEAA